MREESELLDDDNVKYHTSLLYTLARPQTSSLRSRQLMRDGPCPQSIKERE